MRTPLPKSRKPSEIIESDRELRALRDRLKAEEATLHQQKHPGQPAQERAQLINERLHAPRPRGGGQLIPDKDYEGSLIPVYVMSIKPYDRNPRRERNPKFAEIKESIRAMGLQSVFGVTRRPGEEDYMVAGGGNTRLQAMQELYQEGDSRFEMVSCRYVPWKGEAAALAWHVGENEQRADISFWDKANAMMSLKAVLETGKGHEITVRQLEAECRQLGLRMSTTNITVYRFAVERLGALNYKLTNLAARRLQPHYNALRRLAARFGIVETDFVAEIIQPATARYAEDLDTRRLSEGTAEPEVADEGEGSGQVSVDTASLMKEWEVSLGSRIDAGIPVSHLLATLERMPDATREQLTKPAKAAPRRPEGALAETSGPSTAAPAPPPSRARPERGVTDEQLPQVSAGAVAVADAVVVQTPPQGLGACDPDGPPQADAADTPWPREIEAFARLAEAADHLRPCPELPLGYYAEVPERAWASKTAQIAWWLLAQASGQMRLSGAKRLPAGSRFRRALLMEAGLDDSAFACLVEDDLWATFLALRQSDAEDEWQADVALSLPDLFGLWARPELRAAAIELFDLLGRHKAL